MTKIKISRYTEVNKVPRETWKDLIASLALCGYEVIADEEWIFFKLGNDDKFETD